MHRSWIRLSIVIGSLAAAALQADQPPTLVLTPRIFNDIGSGDMPSHSVLVPQGWKAEGGAWWAGNTYFNMLPSQDITVTAPDGVRVRVGPALGMTDYCPSAYAMQQLGARRLAEGQADNGLLVFYMPQTLDEWARWMQVKILPQERPGAAAITVRVAPIPELTELLQQQLAPLIQQQNELNAQSRQMGLGMSHFADAAALAFECAYEQDSRSWEELIVLGVSFMGTQSQTGVQWWWSVEPNASFRAPAGQLEAAMPLLMTIAQSVRPTPAWARMKADHAAAMNRIAAQGAADRSRIIADTSAQIHRMITEGYEQRQAVQDRAHERFVNAIRGVENYTTPGIPATSPGGSETSVQLPNHYAHVYSNGNGEYLLTNDSLYDPNTDAAVNHHTWQTMQPAE